MRLRPMRVERLCRDQIYLATLRLLGHIGVQVRWVAGARVAQLMEALVAGRRPDRPVPPMAGTAAIRAVVHLLATVIVEGRVQSSMSGILAGTAYRLLLA